MKKELVKAHRAHLRHLASYDTGLWVRGWNGWYRLWGRKAADAFLLRFDEETRAEIQKGITLPDEGEHKEMERAQQALEGLNEDDLKTLDSLLGEQDIGRD